MEIDYHRVFLKQFVKLRPEIQNAFYERSSLFRQNKFHPLLNNHKLAGRYSGKRSINITSNFRAIFEDNNKKSLFELIGTHGELYGK